MSKVKKIIVAYASVGTGHKVAAEAIAQQLKNQKNTDVYVVDALNYNENKKYGNHFVGFTNGLASSLFDFTWRKNFTGRILWGGGSFWPKFLFRSFQEIIKKFQPDVIVCTHFVCANVAAKIRILEDYKYHIISVPTDYEIEGMWPHGHTDLFCVANGYMKHTLLSRRVPKEKILITGMPVKKIVTNNNKNTKNSSYLTTNKNIIEEIKEKKNKKIALIICGSQESGPYRHMKKMLNACLSEFAKNEDMEFVFITGKDQDYLSFLLNKISKLNANNFTLLGYTNKIDSMMSVADIAIVKPGGLIISECIKNNLPMLLIGKTYAQENINRRYLITENMAFHATTVGGAVNFLSEVEQMSSKYLSIKNSICQINNENAAEMIAKAATKIAENSCNADYKYHKNVYIGKHPAHTR